MLKDPIDDSNSLNRSKQNSTREQCKTRFLYKIENSIYARLKTHICHLKCRNEQIKRTEDRCYTYVSTSINYQLKRQLNKH